MRKDYSVKYTELGIKIGIPVGIVAVAIFVYLYVCFFNPLYLSRPMAVFQTIGIAGTIAGGLAGGAIGAIMDWIIEKN